MTHLKNSFMGEYFLMHETSSDLLRPEWLWRDEPDMSARCSLAPWHLPLCSPSLYTCSVTQKHALHTLTASKSLHPTCHWRFELLQAIWSDCRWFFRQMPLVFLAHTLTLLPSQEMTSTTQLTVLLFESLTGLACPPWHNSHFMSHQILQPSH